MGRTRRKLERGEPFRDSSLILIATEGEKGEKAYFETLASRQFYADSRVRVYVVPSQSGKSSPEHVLENLKEAVREYDLGPDDTPFLIIDRDRWDERQLRTVAQQCDHCGFSFILSNPCFELWLLVHKCDVSQLSQFEKDRILENPRISKNRRHLEALLVQELGCYSKSNPRFKDIMPDVPAAISNASTLDFDPKKRWIEALFTRVYLVVRRILNNSRSPTRSN